MVQSDWGLKRLCHSCGIKFYDFHKSPIICPDCGEEFDPDALLVGRRRVVAKEAADDDEVEIKPVADTDDGALDDGDDIDLEDDVDLGDTSDDTILDDDEDDMDSNDLGVETYSDSDDEDDS
jgi:uncharacterized protein (TIGR02300 family)